MDKKWKKLPLAAAISAIVAAPVWADTAPARSEVTAVNEQGIVDNNIKVQYGDNSNKVSNTSTLSGNAFKGATGIVHSNVASGIGNLSSNDASLGATSSGMENGVFTISAESTQTSMNNQVEFANDNFGMTENTAIISGSTYDGASGVLGTNVVSGVSNAQANTVAVGYSQDLKRLNVDASSNQNIKSNSVTSGGVDNQSNVNGGFAGSNGIIGINASAGSLNQQSNTVALGKGDLDYDLTDPVSTEDSFIAAESTQNIGVSGSNSVAVDGGETNTNHLSNRAYTQNVFNSGESGIVGVNSSAGDFNAQTNNVALAIMDERVKSDGFIPDATIDASSEQTIQNSDIDYTSNVAFTGSNSDISNNTAKLSDAFTGFTGVAGSNTAAGQANAQANNVAIGYVDNAYVNSNNKGIPVALPTTATSSQVLSDNKVTQDRRTAKAGGNITNEALTAGAFNGAEGILGSNVAAGQANAQSNNVSLAYLTGNSYRSPVFASSDQRVRENSTSSANANTLSQSTATLSLSFNDAEGIVGTNTASGQANAQANNVVVAYDSYVTPNTIGVTANSSSLQLIGGGDGNSNTSSYNGAVINAGEIGGVDIGVMNRAHGILGVNVAAGQFNAQANNVSIAATDSGTSIDADTLNIQASIRNDASYNSSVNSSNTATLSNSFVNATGVMGANLAVGSGNGQTNNVAMHVGDTATSISPSAVNVQASVGNARATSSSSLTSTGTNPLSSDYQLDEIGLSDIRSWTPSSSTSAITIASVNNTASLSGMAFNGATGVIGANVASGIGNLQSNNVSISAATVISKGN